MSPCWARVCKERSNKRSINAVAESFFATLKVELVDRCHYRTPAEACALIFRWIALYNRFRLHSTRGYLPPIEWEHQHTALSPLPSTTAA